eukprot:c10986_g1_i1.p1 GENE.c10986_g1_i1~~c10986_g1_i1.p1  ORF type:complete len:166 (+),score=35.40 c10986_g1_i1:26-523(+)
MAVSRPDLGPAFGGSFDDDILVLPKEYSMEKSFMDQLFFNTGATVATGCSIGGTYGFFEGMRKTGRTTFKLRMNAIINSTVSRARGVGNRVGVLALMSTSLVELGLTQLPEYDPTLVRVGAGAATGVLYTCTTGIRHMAVGSILGAALMGAAVAVEKTWPQSPYK